MSHSAAEAQEHCTCAYCRNFYAAADIECPELRPFLAVFGLDMEAPDELMPYDIQDWICYEGEYVVFGRIIQSGKDRIPVGQAYIWPMEDPDFSSRQPYFVLSLEELETPWILEEPMKDVLSPANEPSFLKKMWGRLLSRFQKDNLES